MKKLKTSLTVLGVIVAIIIATKRSHGQQTTDADIAAALAAALQQNQQLQSYGDAWAARHGYTYNPWTSYYQYRAEREQRSRSDAWIFNAIIDDDR